jgi:UDP-perosamine 4-acetyltransferase
MAGAVIQSGTKVGQDSIINTGTLIDHDCKIADNCHLAPGVICSGGVIIGSNSHLGTGTIVTEFRSIGDNCTVAAGSVVFKDILDNTIFIQTRTNK